MDGSPTRAPGKHASGRANSHLEVDVCVIGAGPVGLALARALAAAGHHIALVESGTAAGDARAPSLNDADVIGDTYAELRLSRSRGPGGTANLWNTESGGRMTAKYMPLDTIDFRERDIVPFSGWPFGRAALDPYYRAAHTLIGLGEFTYEASQTSAALEILRFGDGACVNRLYRFGDASRFTTELPADLAADARVAMLRGATVIEAQWETGAERLQAVRWVGLAGVAGTVRASRFILAAGAIENARLLLSWSRPEAGGPPPADWLGRGFMEHPIDASLELISDAGALLALPGFYGPHDDGARPCAVMGRVGLSGAALDAGELLNATVRIVPIEDDSSPGPTPLRSAAARLIRRGRLRRGLSRVKSAMRGPPGRRGPTRFQVLVDLEQPPHRENRVLLSDRRDELGLPRAELHWRWHAHEESRREPLLALVAEELERAGAGTIRRLLGRALNPNAHHHAGTTRMHTDPRMGVVDENLRMHGIENLYVAGSSAFPTAGCANPTLTAIALALRLADHITDGG